jgi:hypothetical protein
MGCGTNRKCTSHFTLLASWHAVLPALVVHHWLGWEPLRGGRVV